MPAVEVGTLLGKHEPNDLYGFLKHVEPGTDVGKRVAIGGCFPDVPAGAEPEFEAAAGDMVERRGGLGEQCRVSVADIEDQAAPRVARASKCGSVPFLGGAS